LPVAPNAIEPPMTPSATAAAPQTEARRREEANAPESIISIKCVGHVFRSKGRRVQALLETDLQIYDREFLTIVGPSGCGKSTLMNLIVGLFPPSSGEILYRGQRHAGVNRSIGYVTQADNLYPWRTLRSNIEFPLELRGVATRERRQRAERLIHRVGLAGFEDSYPHELSGGMRQRANIVRTLVYEPEVILMDEPFGPLDAQTRLILQNQLLELWQEERKTIIFITHDLGEAVALADRVVVMSARPGRIKTIAPVPVPRPRDLFEIHTDERFRETYRTLWVSLEEEVKKGAVSWQPPN
jgi:NitT/TauT family transport system ATP-binding protein